MNKEAIELVKQYILTTVSNGNSISKESYDLLSYMLQVDRNLATLLYDVYDQIESASPGRYQILNSHGEDSDLSEETEEVY